MERVSKDVLFKAIKKYYLRICICLIISGAIGGGIGCIYAAKEMKEVEYYAEQIQMFEYEKRDGLDYYSQYVEKLRKHYEKTTKYITELNSLVQDDKGELNELLNDAGEWEQTELKFAEEYNVLNFPVLPECIDQKRQNLAYNLYDFEMRKTEVEKNYNLIRDMGDVFSQDEEITKTYGNILSSASSYGTVCRRIDVYKRQLDMLNSRSEREIEETAENMDEILAQAMQKLNRIIEQVNQLAERIAKEKYAVIDAGIGADPRKPDVFGVYIYHMGKKDSAESIICAFVVFFLLFGGCVGLLSAVYKVCKESKESVNN